MQQNENNAESTSQIVDEKTLVLRKPVKVGEQEYTELHLREPTAGELSQATKQANSIDVGIALISLIAKVPKAVVNQLCQRDFAEANDFLGSFTPAGPHTGEML